MNPAGPGVVRSMEAQIATEAHYLARCPVKGCKTVARLPIPLQRKHEVRRYRGEIVWEGDVSVPGFVVDHRVVELRDALRRWQGLVGCVEHRRALRGDVVNGTHNPDVVCDARCMNARRSSCECSCGGANHGGAHG